MCIRDRIFGISIALYTAFGGFRASVLNDTMQGLVMLIGTIVLLIGVVHAAGGLSTAVEMCIRDRCNPSVSPLSSQGVPM